MKRIVISLLVVVGSFLAMMSCQKSGVDAEELTASYKSELLKLEMPAVSTQGKVVEFDMVRDQITYDDERGIYMVTNGDYSRYYTLKLDGELLLDGSVGVDMSTMGIDELKDIELDMKVVKVDEANNIYWLFSQAQNYGFVLRFW